jgi:hypothetical protein
MSNVNNYAFAKHLDQFKIKLIDQQAKKIEEAKKAIDDPLHQWKEGQFAIAEKQLKNYEAWLAFYNEFYDQGVKLCAQHETIVDHLSRWYDSWYANVSNEGKQEAEMMSSQADLLQEIFVDIYKELQPLNLDMKAPKALNL